ncbi:hypothetical protein ZWY2020_028036 [Hordeum vulgare]|nr:hypothetical protein ZWY2020_028036 [Hordeum vulgare]
MGLVPHLCPTQHATLVEWWSMARKRITKRTRKGFDTLVMLVSWSLWKQMNGRVFGRSDFLNKRGTVDLIFEDLRNWTLAGASGVIRMIE